jgi:hypothetical protein
MTLPQGVTYYTPVQGSGAWRDIPLKQRVRRMMGLDWWQPRSALDRKLRSLKLEHLNDEHPFLWNTAVGGLEFWWRFLSDKGTAPDHRDWATAGHHLRLWVELQKVPYRDRNFVLHSHGLQPLMYACAQGLVVRNVITVCSPVRADMETVTALARPRIGHWLHISDPEDDATQAAGSMFDGSVRLNRRHPAADVNDQVPGINHSNSLHEGEYLDLWESLGWHLFLRCIINAAHAEAHGGL